MLCQMELTSHLFVQAVMESCAVNEMVLAKKLIEHTPEHSFPLLDKGFYSLGLLHARQTTGNERHWLQPLKEGTQEVAAVARNDRSPFADSYYQRQGVPSVGLDGQPDALPRN